LTKDDEEDIDESNAEYTDPHEEMIIQTKSQRGSSYSFKDGKAG